MNKKDERNFGEKKCGLPFIAHQQIIAPSLWYNYHNEGIGYLTTKLGGGAIMGKTLKMRVQNFEYFRLFHQRMRQRESRG